MRRLLLVLLALLALAVAFVAGAVLASGDDDQPPAPAAAHAAPDTGHVRLRVRERDLAAEPGARRVLDRLELAGLVDQLDARLRLPRDIRIDVRADPDEAYYDPDARRIVLSPAFIADTLDTMRDTYESADDAEVAAASSIEFTVLHEFGHALVDVLDLPVTGLEETAVDEFAAVALIDEVEDPIAVLEASDWFDAIAATPEDADLYDEHALDQQRFFHLRCIVYGTDPDEYADELEGLGVDDDRAAGCVEESEQVRASWHELLRPYLRVAGRRGAGDGGDDA